MNIGFPKPKNAIAALGEIGVACPVSFRVGLLNRVQIARIDRRVGVPEVPVPLDDSTRFCNQNIDYELATDYLLLTECYSCARQDGTASSLKFVGFLISGKAKRSVDSFHVRMVVAAGVRAILDSSLEPPSRNIKRLSAGFARLNLPLPAKSKRALTCFFFCSSLPSVRAGERAEANLSLAPGIELLTAPFAGVSATGIAYIGGIGTGRKLTATSDTSK